MFVDNVLVDVKLVINLLGFSIKNIRDNIFRILIFSLYQIFDQVS